MNQELELRVIGKPEETLCSGDFKPEGPVFFISDEGVELNRVKRPSSFIDKTRDIVFDCLWNIFSFISLSDPFLANFSFFQVKSLLEDFLQIDFRITACHDF